MRHRKSSALVVGTHKPEKTRDCWVFPSVLLQKWSALFCLLLGSLYCLAGNYGRKREKWKLTCVTNECVWDWSLRPWIIPEVQNEPRADCMSCTNSKKEVCEIQNKWLKFKSSCWSGEIQTERVHWDEFLPLGYCSLPFLGSSAFAKQSLNAKLGVTVLNIL